VVLLSGVLSSLLPLFIQNGSWGFLPFFWCFVGASYRLREAKVVILSVKKNLQVLVLVCMVYPDPCDNVFVATLP